jgi:two-component system cell cycle sensor histidine kinase/response regulator CckA
MTGADVLRVLLVEDDPDDAEILRRELRRTGLDCLCERVETREAFQAALERQPDLILADYRLPRFGALEALRLLREGGHDVPVIVVTGFLGDEAAIECLREGATDYLLKDRLRRLGQATRNALEQGRLRAEQRNATAALRASEEQYRLLFAEAPHPMWVVDVERLCFLAVNEQAVRHYGYSREELLAMTLHDVRPPEEVPPMLDGVRQLASGEALTGHYRHRTKAGEVREVLEVSKPLVFAGRPAALTVVDDVTERRRLEERLRQAQKMEAIGKLAGGVAHDFNNLLTAILGYSHLLAGALEDRPRLLGHLEEIRKAGERGAALTRQLLAFSRGQALQPRATDLNAIVRDIETLLRRLIGEDIELVTRLAANLGQILIDPGQVEQLIVNLSVNARDAMPEGGTLVLETAGVDLDALYVHRHPEARPGPYIRLAVSDTGIGMDAKTSRQIFEPFFTTKEPGKGTGLGLSTVYGIVHQNGGQIEIYSEPGRGATFKVYFPRVTGESVAPQLSAGLEHSLAAGSETILLLEDEAALRTLIRAILESGGYQVLEEESPATALALARSHAGPIDLVLTDIVMPGMSGPEIAASLSALRPNSRVLFMSGYSSSLVSQQKTLPAGAQMVEKPFSAESLLRKVRHVLDAALG